MTENAFAKSGYMARVRPDAEVTRFQVLGERSSGTNFVKRLIGRNSDLQPTEALGWKHGFAQAAAIPPDLAVIGVVRRADDWVRSMHAKPWHCSPDMQRLEFSRFLRAEWDTRVDRPRYFPGAKVAGTLGQPLQLDRHPLTGRRFANLLELRRAKLAGLLSYMERDCTFILVRLEAVAAAPEEMLDRILSAVGQPVRTTEFRPVLKRLGARFKPAVDARPPTPEHLSADDLDFLLAHVDSAQETALGYTY